MTEFANRRSLVANVRHSLEWLQKNLNTAMPGIVRDFDAETGLASVQPAIKVRLVDDTERELPVLTEVPVLYQSGGGFSLTYPLREGDPVMLIFSQRGLSQWRDNRSEVASPDRGIFHSMLDAVAIPGFIGSLPRGDHLVNLEIPGLYDFTINGIRITEFINRTADTPLRLKRTWRILGTHSLNAGEWHSVSLDLGIDEDGQHRTTLDPHSDLSFKFVVNGGASSVQMIASRDILREPSPTSTSSTSNPGVIRIVFSEFHDAYVARSGDDRYLSVRSEPAAQVTIEEYKYYVDHTHETHWR